MTGSTISGAVLGLSRMSPRSSGLLADDIASRTRCRYSSAVHRRAQTQNRENNPMQSSERSPDEPTGRANARLMTGSAKQCCGRLYNDAFRFCPAEFQHVGRAVPHQKISDLMADLAGAASRDV